MKRSASHLHIREGQRAYREDVPSALEASYLDSGAGLETCSVFERDSHVLGYIEVEDPDAIRDVMKNSETQAE